MRHLMIAILLLAFGVALHAQSSDVIHEHSDGIRILRTRTVKAQPINLKAKNLNADQLRLVRLYYSVDGGRSWTMWPGELQESKQGADDHYIKFDAESDGLYLFKYVFPGDPIPVPYDDFHNRFHIDTTAPSVNVISPAEGQVYPAKVAVPIRFDVVESYPKVSTGLTLLYRIDEGEWIKIAENQPTNEPYDWKHPFENATQVDLRFEVRDRVGNYAPVDVMGLSLGGTGERRLADKPVIHVEGPKPSNIIYFENTDFYYNIINDTGSPTSYVCIWYTMDGGKTWKAGGADYSGEASGKVTVNFPDGFKRGPVGFGYYEQIGFMYQVVCESGASNKEDPQPGTSIDETFAVDMVGPKLHITAPSLGDKVYRGQVPGNTESGKLKVEWGGADYNLIPFVTKQGHERGPVSIYYTTTPYDQVPTWTAISTHLPIRYSFTKWNDLPPGDCMLKVVARDQMGNQTVRMTGVFTVLDGTGHTDPDMGLANPEVDRLWGKATQYYDAKDYKRALEYFDKALKVAPGDRMNAIKHDKSLALYRDGQPAKAIELLDAVVKNEATNHTYRYALASLLYSTAKSEMAREHLQTIAENDASEPHVKARHLLATIEFDAGNNARAIELWKHIVQHASPASAEYTDAQANLTRYGNKGGEKKAEQPQNVAAEKTTS